MHSVSKVLIAVTATGCLFVVGLNQACTALSSEPDVDELHARAQSLLPTGAEVIQTEDSICTMFSSTDCTTVAFFREASLDHRERLVEERAEQAGWACTATARPSGALSLDCEADGYSADIHLLPEPERSCRGRPLNDCDSVDTIFVTAPHN